MTRRGVLVAAALIAGGAVPGSAAAATTVGDVQAQPDPDPVACDTSGCTAIGAVVPVDGIVVRWSVHSATTGGAALRIVRGDGPFALAGLTETVEVAPGVTSHEARLPVRAGDRLALFGEEGLPAIFTPPGTGLTPVVEEHGRWMFDEQREADGQIDGTPLLQAVVEPDADGDGWGDETQDRCPGERDVTGRKNLPCGEIALGHATPAVLPPGGGPVTHRFILRNDVPADLKNVRLRLQRVGTGAPLDAETAVRGCAGSSPHSVCTLELFAAGETREVEVAYGFVGRRVTTRLRVEPRLMDGSWWLRPGAASPTVQVTTRVATLSELRMAVATKAARMTAAGARVALTCPPTDIGPCRARLEVRTARTPKGARAPRVLLRRTVTVPAGDVRTLRLRFSRAAMRFLRPHRRTPVRILATRTFGTSGEVTGRARATLTASRPR